MPLLESTPVTPQGCWGNRTVLFCLFTSPGEGLKICLALNQAKFTPLPRGVAKEGPALLFSHCLYSVKLKKESLWMLGRQQQKPRILMFPEWERETEGLAA
jgi:hypothetical protein